VRALLPTRFPRRLTVGGAIALSALIATFFAFLNVNAISLAPPKVTPRHLEIGAASTHVLLDAPTSLVTDQNRNTNFQSLVSRATLFGDILASPPLRQIIGRRIGVPADDIAATSRLTSTVQREMREPDSVQRANQILNSTQPYRLDIQADPTRPIIHIYAQGPSAPAAVSLANASVAGLIEYLKVHAVRTGSSPKEQVVLEQLGRARGGVVNSKTKPEIVGLTFLVVFGISLGLLLGAVSVRRGWVAAGRGEAEPQAPAPADASHEPVRAHRRPSMLGSAASPARIRRRTPRSTRETVRSLVNAGGDWPRTTRVMPWLIAGFFALLWLVPFNVIQLSASLPFDLKLDRLVLPILMGTWIMSLASGGPAAPRVRLTVVHVGVAVFIATVCLGLVIDAHYLNGLLEFEPPVKRITLLLSFGLFFLIVASSVRRSEVPAFMKYTLVLAILCALGTIWEYRFHYNVFYQAPHKFLPGFFQVGMVDSTERDEIGRLMTRGPAEHPLETVGMLSMAFPIALVGIIHSKERRERVLYSLAACILLAAAISTYRKSALLAPVSVALTIAFFRRRELLRLAPLGVVSLVVIHALSPGALGSILFQLHPNRLGVSTVSDRTADYDAIRPDVWTHLAFGRGYGSYDHVAYRVLDSEVLSRLVDTGVLGLMSLFFMLLCIVMSARELIRSRDPVWAPPALAVAAAAIAFLVLAFLFDVSSFPHTPYILMSLAGLLAVTLSQPVQERRSSPPRVGSFVRSPVAGRSGLRRGGTARAGHGSPTATAPDRPQARPRQEE
jgi:hypothetical protein